MPPVRLTETLSVSREPRADLHGAREAVHGFEQLEFQVGIESRLAREALYLLERRGVQLPADERGEPVVDEEDLASALELGQGREREIEKRLGQLGVLDRVEGVECRIDPALGEARIAEETLEVGAFGLGAALGGRRRKSVAAAVVARIG